jgi:hypothetical protein
MGVFDGALNELPASWGLVMGQLGNGAFTTGQATGYVTTASTGGAIIRATAYAPQGANAQRSLVSTSANDTSAGTGARTITINYLNTSFQLKQDTITMNGTTAVNTNATDIAFIESLVVATCGSTAGNVGTIRILTGLAGAGSVWASIAASDNQTFYCHHYVPTGLTCYVTNIAAGATVNAGVFTLQHTGNPLSTTTPTFNIGGWYNHLAGGNEDHTYTLPVAITGPDYIYLIEQPHAATAGNVYGTFEYLQF